MIVGNLDLLQRRIADPALRARVDTALQGAERGAALTRQLLAFSRRQPLEPQPTNLNRLVGEVAALLRRSLGERIEVEVVTAAGLWTVLADPGQVENALINLAFNARDAMPDGGRLSIEVSNSVLDESYARGHSEVKAGYYPGFPD